MSLVWFASQLCVELVACCCLAVGLVLMALGAEELQVGWVVVVAGGDVVDVGAVPVAVGVVVCGLAPAVCPGLDLGLDAGPVVGESVSAV